MTIFQGTFKPPVIGRQQVPIKITGSGYCDVTSDGLGIQGFKQTSKVNSSQLFILFFILFFGLAGLRAIWPEMPNWLMIIPFSVAIFPFTQSQGTDHQSEPIELFIPWQYISDAKLDKDSMAVMICVKKFRHQNERYKGALFFDPLDGADSLLKALQDQVRR